ncbi:MAG: SIMPL domain-containing protein, partial [Deferribacteraceae bacterium]|nr:SIMPL domain-containing protein [Deferribacteraceae bacterium]
MTIQKCMFFKFAAILLSVVISATAAFAEDDKRYITISGSAEIKVKPDRLTVSLGVDIREKNLAAAK